MQYRIIRVAACFSQQKAIDQLAKEVNEAIHQGWAPLGGLAVQGTAYLQAMIKTR